MKISIAIEKELDPIKEGYLKKKKKKHAHTHTHRAS